MNETATPAQRQNQIVVGVDGSPASRAALVWALREAVASGSPVRAVLVWHERGVFAPVTQVASTPLNEEPRPTADDYLDRLREMVADARYQVPDAPAVTERVVEGHPGRELVRASRDARLLVVGSRGHGRIGTALLGSVSTACVRDADCPVVIIGPDLTAAAEAALADHAQPTG